LPWTTNERRFTETEALKADRAESQAIKNSDTAGTRKSDERGERKFQQKEAEPRMDD
jgi:hypothetical protein